MMYHTEVNLLKQLVFTKDEPAASGSIATDKSSAISIITLSHVAPCQLPVLVTPGSQHPNLQAKEDMQEWPRTGG